MGQNHSDVQLPANGDEGEGCHEVLECPLAQKVDAQLGLEKVTKS